MKTKKQKAQEVLDGLLRPEDTTHGTLEIVLQMCKDAGLNELYTAVEPIYLQKKQIYSKKSCLYPQTWVRLHMASFLPIWLKPLSLTERK